MLNDSLVREARFPVNEYSKRQVVAAGKILKERIPADSDPDGRLADLIGKSGVDVLDAFRIAHNWRDSHMRPLMLVRAQLAGKLRAMKNESISAARLKRMHSIRSKMRKRPLTLYQMQDIAGCRAIVPSNNNVNDLVSYYSSDKCRHTIQDEDNYVQSPKGDGYRSHHVILKFNGEGADEVYNRQTVEVQIRTRAQHAWATAVEAVGLINHENIKGGDGSKEWRRFFELMSSEIAYEEDCPLCPSADAPRNEIRDELRDLSASIEAVKTLESVNRSIKHFEDSGSSGANYFLLQFDYKTQSVSVEPFFDYVAGSNRYVEAERDESEKNSVLVEVNQISDLRQAFPNYFLDVGEFTERLKHAISPKTASPNPKVREKAEAKWNLSWLQDYQRRHRK